jgi:isochorismate synthase
MRDCKDPPMNIATAIGICLGKDVQFAVYRLPGEDAPTLLVQKGAALNITGKLAGQLPEKGFLIVPFSKQDHQAYFIVPDMVLHNDMSASQMDELKALPPRCNHETGSPCPQETCKDDYLNLVGETLVKIRTGAFKKAVLSRIKTITGNYSIQLPEIFRILCEVNPNAFVYLFHIRGQCWIGASPEPFICSEKDEIKTVSLAGTRSYRENNLDLNQWNRKELEEQEYVTLHIESILQSFKVKDYRKKGPYVARAGNLLHLRTDFTFSSRALGSNLPLLVDALHPTPAVCGIPTHEAMEFIRKAERHQREYYAGFLGPVGIHDKLQLYVNLRCLKVYPGCLVLYTGGGITDHSEPGAEWEETEIKAETLLSVIKSCK